MADEGNGKIMKGNIALVGFEILEPSEMEVVKKIVGNYVVKMGSIAGYKEMRMSLQQHKHGKTFKHEISAFAIFNEGKFNAESTDWNLYTALSDVCEKMLAEVEHMIKKEQRHDKPLKEKK